jgi:IPT/TIG domain
VVTSLGQTTASDTATLTIEADQITLARVVPNPATSGAKVTLLGHNLLDPGPPPVSPPVVTIGGQPVPVVAGSASNDQLVVDTAGLAVANAQVDVVVSRAGLPASPPVQLQWQPALTGATLTAAGPNITLTVNGTALPAAGVGTVSLELTGQPTQTVPVARSGNDIQVTFPGPMPAAGTTFGVTVVDQFGRAARFQANA